jgi:hypothetical protein
LTAQPDTDLASRIAAWFVERRGRRVKVGAGAYAFDRNEVPEGTRLMVATTIGASFEAFERTLEELTIVVQLGETEDGSALFIAPADVLHFEFGSQGRDFLRLYFADMAYLEVVRLG